MKRLNIAILFGGYSPEYKVSLQSAYSVIKHIDTNRYEPILIGISSKGDWYRFLGDIDKIVNDTWCNPSDCVPVAFSPNRGEHNLLMFYPDRIVKIPIDVAFPILHGKNGEDGTVQGMFELAGIPLAGCGTLSSALCMDKHKAHKQVQAVGVLVPASFQLKKNMDVKIVIEKVESLGYPLFVKPVRAGSSYGITRVTSVDELQAAIKLAFEYDDEIILEENIVGAEFGCAVMGNDVLTVGEVDEIELTNGFFNFDEKYTLKTSAIHVPARVSKEKANELKQTARLIYRTLGCRGFARVDMFLDTNEKVIFNEVNTIPGFTDHSRYPNMMKAIGISFEDVISRVIEMAVEK